MSKTTKKIRRTKSTSQKTDASKAEVVAMLVNYPDPHHNTLEAFKVIEGFTDMDIIRTCAVGIQDLGIIDVIDGWANGIEDVASRCKKVLFDNEGKVQKRYIRPSNELTKFISTSEVPVMIASICMMAGVLAFIETEEGQ